MSRRGAVQLLVGVAMSFVVAYFHARLDPYLPWGDPLTGARLLKTALVVGSMALVPFAMFAARPRPRW